MEKNRILKTSEAKRRTNKQYDKRNAVQFSVKFIKTTELDMIEKLEEQENKAGYIKRLIREDIAREKQEKGVK